MKDLFGNDNPLKWTELGVNSRAVGCENAHIKANRRGGARFEKAFSNIENEHPFSLFVVRFEILKTTKKWTANQRQVARFR